MSIFGDFYKDIPHKNSYLYMNSVDACFYLNNRESPCVVFSAKWGVDSKDLSAEKMTAAIETINNMLNAMQRKVDEILGSTTERGD